MALAAAATDVDLLVDDVVVDDFDDVILPALDLDLLLADNDDRAFRGGGGAYYSAIFSDADIVSHCRHACEDGGDGDSGAAAAGAWLLAGLSDDDDCGDDGPDDKEAGSSPADSGVTDDGPLAPAAGGDADAYAEAMSAYVAELERFLLDDDEDNDNAPCCEQADVVDHGRLLGVVDDYFAGDQLLATAEVVVPAPASSGRAEPTDGDQEEENADVLVLAAPEDEQSASRKRARNKIKGTPWRELEVMNLMLMHLAQIQVPAAPWPTSCGSSPVLCCM